jgi:hypothetical protein
MRPLLPILLLVLGACATSGGPRSHGGVDVFNDAVYTALANLQDQEATDYAIGNVPVDVHRQFNAALLPGLKAGRALNAAIATWQPGTPLPSDVRTLVQAIGETTRLVASALPDTNPAKAHLLVYTNAVQAAILAFLDSLATSGGL